MLEIDFFEKLMSNQTSSFSVMSGHSRILCSLRYGEYVSLDDFKSACKLEPYLLEDSLCDARHPCNRHILEYVLSKGVKPTSGSLFHAARANTMEGAEFLVEFLKDDPDKTKTLTTALYLVVTNGDKENVPGIEFLIAQGADPKDFHVVDRSITCGSFKIVRTLDTHGAVFVNEHVDIALRFGQFEVGYWLYQKGLRGVDEVPYSFLQYKAERDAERDAAVRKIYFWILPKLYRNSEFVMRQASKSYDTLFGQ